MEVSEGSDLGGPSECHGSRDSSDIRTDGTDVDMAVSLDQSSEDLAEESDPSQFELWL